MNYLVSAVWTVAERAVCKSEINLSPFSFRRTLDSFTALSGESRSPKPRSTEVSCSQDLTVPPSSNPDTLASKNAEAGPNCCSDQAQKRHFHFLRPDAQTMMSDPVLLPTFSWSHGPRYSGVVFWDVNSWVMFFCADSLFISPSLFERDWCVVLGS